MHKYYKIPLTERLVTVNNRSLFQILQEHYPDLYERERGRVELTYGGDNPGAITPQLECEIEKYNKETANLYKAMGVPSHIIAYQVDDGSISEYCTGASLESHGYYTFFKNREVSQAEAYQLLDEENNYSAVVSKMFAQKEKPKSLGKRICERFLGKKDN